MQDNEKQTDMFTGLPPGVCIPWEEKMKELGDIKGNCDIIKNEWESIEAFAYMYLWWWVHR